MVSESVELEIGIAVEETFIRIGTGNPFSQLSLLFINENPFYLRRVAPPRAPRMIAQEIPSLR
jgi:hypothetical protein